MVQNISIENSFIGGLKTEFTGLNFPENACTECNNSVFTLVGDVLRREGIDFETNFTLNTIDRTNRAISTYKWNNVGGDGQTQVIVLQVGSSLYFFQSTNATISSPLSTTRLISTVDLTQFLPTGSSLPISTLECQYTDGNGYLFVFHPSLDSIYCTFTSGVVTPNRIAIQIRDLVGIFEPGVADNNRPITLTNEHNYNLQNQGWSSAPSWNVTSTNSQIVNTGTQSWTVQTGQPISAGQSFSGVGYVLSPFYQQSTLSGTVVSYNSGTGLLTLNVFSVGGAGTGYSYSLWQFNSVNVGNISTWFSAIANYPSNADVWWEFKNSSGVFSPGTTINNVTLDTAPAPKGFFIFNAFNQDRSSTSGVLGLTPVSTNVRPKTGAWFQGRVWYAGVDASFPPSGDQPYSTWSETIYFSQVVTQTAQVGRCYQLNDPTSETAFDLLPTDGGTIQIQGCGSIYKLFPIQSGLLVFASNGVWFIAGGSALGFTATSYTISRISAVQSISGTSFVDVLGYPMFWNEEGIYYVSPNRQAGSMHSPDIALNVENLCLGTILSFYNNIPLQSKKFVRGAYNPLTFVLSWIYRSTNESTVTDRYQFDSSLNINTANRAFYPYSISNTMTSPYVNGINYVSGPGGSTSPSPTFKYLTSIQTVGTYNFTFSEEKDSVNWVDFFSNDGVGLNYLSDLTIGYKLHGKGVLKWQPDYIYVFSRASTPTSYLINTITDYGRTVGTQQLITNGLSKAGMVYRRHRLSGHGVAFQMYISSVQGKPFDLMGWTLWEQISESP